MDQGLADSKPPSSLSIPTTELYFGGTYITKICDHPVSKRLLAVCGIDMILKLDSVKNLSSIPEKKLKKYR